MATGGDALAIKRDAAGVSGLVIGGNWLPTERDGRFWVHYTGMIRRDSSSALDVLEGRVPAERLQNRIALVGASAVGLQDLRPTPLEPAMPGVVIHAQVLETILAGAPLVRPNFALVPRCWRARCWRSWCCCWFLCLGPCLCLDLALPWPA